MIYNSYEKIINEDPQILKNGVDLKSGSSTITVKWSDNSDANSANAIACLAPALSGNIANKYVANCLCVFQRLFSITEGQVQIHG
jgi:hypothetical protein